MKPRSNLYEERISSVLDGCFRAIVRACARETFSRMSVTCHVLQHDAFTATISVASRVLCAAVVARGAAAAAGAADSAGSRAAAALRAS